MIIKIEKLKKAGDKRSIGTYLMGQIQITGLKLKEVFKEPFYYKGKDIIMYKSNVCWFGFISHIKESKKYPFTIYDYKSESDNYLDSDIWSIGSIDGIDKELIIDLISYIFNYK